MPVFLSGVGEYGRERIAEVEAPRNPSCLWSRQRPLGLTTV
jgi:hypothetical protein